MGYLSSIAKRSIYDGGTFGAAKWDGEGEGGSGIIKRSLSLSFAFNTDSLSLSAVSPPRLASDEIYGYGNRPLRTVYGKQFSGLHRIGFA